MEALTSWVEINGEPPSVDDLHFVASRNYGHFTSMQVRDGAVRGWDLHMRRLQDSSRELFGRAVDPARVRESVLHALQDTTSASVRVNVFARRSDPGQIVEPDLMVTVSPAVSAAPAAPWRVGTVRYERDFPHIKHVGTFGLLQQRRIAHAAGLDDPLFVDRTGHVSEGAIWNVGFWDGERVIWPDAPRLTGITMQLISAGLEKTGVPSVTRPVTVDEVSSLRAAFATYSICPAQPIGSIDGIALAPERDLDELLMTAWGHIEPETL